MPASIDHLSEDKDTQKTDKKASRKRIMFDYCGTHQRKHRLGKLSIISRLPLSKLVFSMFIHRSIFTKITSFTLFTFLITIIACTFLSCYLPIWFPIMQRFKKYFCLGSQFRSLIFIQGKAFYLFYANHTRYKFIKFFRAD